ncbi:lytic transglycosylase domain-containing protein [Ktedonobacteria bacterium brp13]|nr:lytic transglycosylase domain-containing protein [Ktedonobacteria bacterium brp13]
METINLLKNIQKTGKIASTLITSIMLVAMIIGVMGSIQSVVNGNNSTTYGSHKVQSAGQHVQNAVTQVTKAAPAQAETKAPAFANETTSVQTVNAPISYSTSYQSIARSAAVANGINPDRFVRQIQQESGFNPNAVSPAGAIGIAQFMPGTAAGMGINPHDPVASLNAAARMMGNLDKQFGGDYNKALAAYNAGPGAVQNAVRRGGGNWLSYLPTETRNYVAII